MLLWTLQITIISVILIFLVHHLISFFKTTLTTPKIKDLVNSPAQKYEDIYNTISSSGSNSISGSGSGSIIGNNIDLTSDYTDVPTISAPDVNSMKNELKNFLKSQLKADNNGSNIPSFGSTDINSLQPYTSSGSSNYSTF
jgi:hypothetical protein